MFILWQTETDSFYQYNLYPIICPKYDTDVVDHLINEKKLKTKPEQQTTDQVTVCCLESRPESYPYKYTNKFLSKA